MTDLTPDAAAERVRRLTAEVLGRASLDTLAGCFDTPLEAALAVACESAAVAVAVAIATVGARPDDAVSCAALPHIAETFSRRIVSAASFALAQEVDSLIRSRHAEHGDGPDLAAAVVLGAALRPASAAVTPADIWAIAYRRAGLTAWSASTIDLPMAVAAAQPGAVSCPAGVLLGVVIDGRAAPSAPAAATHHVHGRA